MDFLEFLKMKSIINKIAPSFNWRLKRFNESDDTQLDYIVCLDDGSQTYYRIHFDKNKYDLEDIFNMSVELSKILNIKFESFEFNK